MRPVAVDEPTRDIGPYRHAHRFAIGGMAEVYRALWPQTAGADRAVVIKRLRHELHDDAEQRAMFQREISLGRRIDHDNVVSVLDHGLDDGVPYLVLEYVFGVDLWRLARGLRSRSNRLRVPLSVWMATELLAGLDAVHRVTDDGGAPLHVVHRDVSPSNVFLSVHGDVKLGDLGIARAALRPGAMPRERGSRAKGKLGYLPPEQVSGIDVDQRADVFSAAVVTAELLMGRPLFSGATEIGVLLAIRDGDLSPFRAIARDLPHGLGDVVLSALARDREQRTASAAELRAQLLEFVVEPVPDLQRELGRLVVAELDEQADASHRGALAKTIEKDAAWFERETPPANVTPLPESEGTFEVRRGSEVVGHYNLGELVGAIATGDVEAMDTVKSQRGAAKSVSSIPELARHLPISTRTPTLRRRTQLAQTSELYSLEQRSMLGVLADALVARDAGLLLCERGDVRKEVYLEAGVPCFVSSNQPTELLGEALVSKGVIARNELDMALAVMPRFEGRLGETLVALGLIDPIELFMHISEQVREKLLELFEWSDGHVALYRDVERPERGFPLAPDSWGLLEEGAARRLKAGLDALDPRGLLIRTGLALELPPRLSRLATTCGAGRSVAEVEKLAGDAAEERARMLVLLEVGILKWRRSAGTS